MSKRNAKELTGSTGYFETDGGLAVAEGNPQGFGDVAKSILGQLSNDRKAWAALATEVADGADIPSEAILQRLAPCWEINPEQVRSCFESDVAAIKTVRRSTFLDKKNQAKLKKFHSEHSTSADLNKQINEMLVDLRQLRLLTRKVAAAESAGHNWTTQRAMNQAPRIFNQQ